MSYRDIGAIQTGGLDIGAIQSQGGVLIWDLTDQESTSTWALQASAPTPGRIFRGYIENAFVSVGSQKIFIRFRGHATTAITIRNAAFGKKKASADPYDYDNATIESLKFGGSDSVTIPAGTLHYDCDPFDYVIDANADYIIATQFNTGDPIPYLTGGAASQAYKGTATDETEIQDATGYTENQYCGPGYKILSLVAPEPGPVSTILDYERSIRGAYRGVCQGAI